MNSYRKSRKDAIKRIRTVSDYYAFMNQFKLSPIERKIADMVFIDALPYVDIAERIGYSESSVKKKMRRILSII